MSREGVWSQEREILETRLLRESLFIVIGRPQLPFCGQLLLVIVCMYVSVYTEEGQMCEVSSYAHICLSSLSAVPGGTFTNRA